MYDVWKLIAFINTWLCKVQETKNFVEDCLENTWYKIERMSLYDFMIWSTQFLPKINWCLDVDAKTIHVLIGLRIVSLLHYVARYLRERVLPGLAFGTAAASVTLEVEQAGFFNFYLNLVSHFWCQDCVSWGGSFYHDQNRLKKALHLQWQHNWWEWWHFTTTR